MFGLGTVEIIVIFGVILLMFGGKRLPELASGIGKSIKAFKKEMKKDNTQITDADAEQNNTTGKS